MKKELEVLLIPCLNTCHGTTLAQRRIKAPKNIILNIVFREKHTIFPQKKNTKIPDFFKTQNYKKVKENIFFTKKSENHPSLSYDHCDPPNIMLEGFCTLQLWTFIKTSDFAFFWKLVLDPLHFREPYQKPHV